MGTAPALTAPRPAANDTSKTRAQSSERNDPRGIACSPGAFLCLISSLPWSQPHVPALPSRLHWVFCVL